MLRKSISALVILILFSLVLGRIGTANAQDAQPSNPPDLPFTPPFPPEMFPYDEDHFGKGSPFLTQSASDVSTQALTLGASGTSFRYMQTLGTASEPYLVDGTHLISPNGLFIDSLDTLFVAEEGGARVLAYNPAGTNIMTLGYAGQPWHHNDFLSTPKDVVKDAAGNIWIAYGNSAIKEFDSVGNLIQIYPELDPWQSGNTNDRFDDPRGIAFDAAGLMYVSDGNNHRVQVYDISGVTPSYVRTIGVTAVAKSDNSGFDYPGQIAFDSLGRLYVVDSNNYRVQRCTFGTDWVCATFFGVTDVYDTDLVHLGWANGIDITDTDNIFIADSSNNRVLKCTTSAVCALFAGTGVPGIDNTQLDWPADVAADSSGNIFVSEAHNLRIQKFNSGGVYQSTIGTTGVPYLTDNNHFNNPWGIALAPDNSIYILESGGYRLIKLNSSGVFQWSVGQAGIYGSDNSHFGDPWGGPKGDPAIDAGGNVYIPDTHNDRVQIFTSNGAYLATLGSLGTGSYGLTGPSGVSISPINGDIYVVDTSSHRIQVFNSSRIYKFTLGVTGVSGSDNAHFNYPYGMVFDASGNIYVADHDNQRVQKCTPLGGAPWFSCITFAGETGVSGSDFGHLGGPISVKVDGSGKVYVADEWNSRVQVFDSSGGYLTTISGSWGATNSDLISPSGLALDTSGNVYVADRDNHRIQKYAPGYPGWVQSNINGFGNPSDSVNTLDVFNGKMYAGGGGKIWNTSNGTTWAPVVTDNFGNVNNGISSFAVFNNALYAGLYNYIDGGGIYRSLDGIIWTNVMSGGFGSINNADITNMVAYNGYLYAGVLTNDGTGEQIWRSSDGTTWSSFTFGIPSTYWWSFEVYNGQLYVSSADVTGGILYRTDGTTWTAVTTDGFGDANNTAFHGLASFKGNLYVTTRNFVDGAQVWRSSTGDAGSWTKVATAGLGDVMNARGFGLIVEGTYLYLDITNTSTGDQVYRTLNGTTWEQVVSDGWGDVRYIYSDYMDKNAAVFNNNLYIGGWSASGGQIWRPTLTTFKDVSRSYWSWTSIERLYSAGITGGCTTVPFNYCPATSVTRAQMAVFLLRGIHGSTYTPPPATGTKFADVPLGTFGAAWIEQLATEGITSGCGGGNYCPTTPVSRAQMAIFLVRAKHGVAFVPPTATGIFADVPVGSFGANFIEQLVTDAITSGCGSGNYCPNTTVKRDSMAVFLVKTFNLP